MCIFFLFLPAVTQLPTEPLPPNEKRSHSLNAIQPSYGYHKAQLAVVRSALSRLMFT